MLLAEYDYDTDIAVQRRESFEDGFSAGEKRGRNEGISIGLSQGAHQKAVETAKKFLAMGLSVEQVATGTGLSLEEIEKL
jgi:predicted transposase/invertase (TIGR01784 family)